MMTMMMVMVMVMKMVVVVVEDVELVVGSFEAYPLLLFKKGTQPI